MEILNKINKILAYPLLGLIWVYQRTLSPDHGFMKIYYPHGYCRFYPTCSEYAKQILKNEGLTGLPLIFIRIAKCNPFVRPSVDLPPHRN
jgi:putative membrane protein insertion efficiency factor